MRIANSITMKTLRSIVFVWTRFSSVETVMSTYALNATLLFIRVHIFVESGSQRKENHENVLLLKHLAFAAAKFVVEAMSMSIYIDMFCPMSFLVYVL